MMELEVWGVFLLAAAATGLIYSAIEWLANFSEKKFIKSFNI